MFNILQEWLISKLGANNCWNLNLNNVGERFKDGVLFARLLQKYQVIPDYYIQDFKKSNCYTVCLRNVKNIHLWLKFLDIIIEDDTIHELADGQSLAVTKLLYQLYLRLEMLRHSVKHNDNNTMSIELINNNSTNFCKSNDLSILFNQDGKKHKEKIINTNKQIFNSLKLFCCLNGIEYTAIDVLKSKKNTNTNASKNYALNFIRNNMNYFYDLFMKNLNNKLFINDYDEKYNEICSNTIFYILNIKEDTITADTMSYVSQEEIKNENSIFNSMEVESSRTQSSDEYSNTNLVKQDTLNDYIQHTRLWSSEYLNIDPFKCKQDILSMLVGEVLNFENGKSEIKFLEIKKTNITAVIDIIHNKKVIQLIKNHLDSKDILSFTADDTITACLNDYKKEMMISVNKDKLYQVLEDYEHQVTLNKYSNNAKQEKNIDTNNIVVKNKKKSSSTISKRKMNKSVPNVNTESIIVTDEKLNINKLTQTPEQIPEPDYNNPILSSMATLGKLIHEKQKKNHDLQIGDLINCIGEFIKKNQGKNGWVLLNFPVQPLQMALLEYKLTGKIPNFGKEICKPKKKSNIISEYQDSENIYASKNTYLSNCIKIIQHKDEIKNEKWIDFLQFYKQLDCIQVLVTHVNDVMTYHKRAANELIGLILKEENELETKMIFKSINMFDNERVDNITESESSGQHQISELSLISNYEESDSINSKQISNEFQLLSTDNRNNLKNYTYTALYLCRVWETMEHNYTYQIKELINFKEHFFEEIKINMDLITNTVNHTMRFNNPSITNLINKYENESQNLIKDNTTHLVNTIFELQTNLWDTIDSQLQQITAFITQLIDQLLTNNTLINIHKQLIEIELKRTTATLHFLNKYYDDNVNEYKTNEFDFYSDMHENADDIEMFELFCNDIIYKIEKYIESYYKVIEITDNQTWTQSVQTEKNRFVCQVYRIKASMIKDKMYLEDVTKMDHYLEKIHNIYQFKINDINKLCEILKCAADIGKSIKGHINQISGKFYINETSIYELIHNHMFDSRNKFSMKQLKTIANKLLDNVPKFKISINDLTNTLNELSKVQHIYPTNWPTDGQLYNKFPKEILGSNVTTIDWRDFVVQCMELPYPNIDQLLIYRNIFQTYDIGDETISVENYMKTKLWFENESHQYNEAKWLLCDMYQIQNRLNYSTMLLAFCRDEEPWIGLGKSFSLIFGWNPFNAKMLPINQSDYRIYEGLEVDVEDNNCNSHLSDLSNEIFILNKNIMIWFLKTILKFYMDSETLSETLLGIINISQIVESIFAHLQTKEVKPMVINLFQNHLMDELYNTVHKFQIKELSEVAKMIVMTNKVL